MSKIKANASTSNRCEKNDGVHYVVEGNLWIDDVIFNFTLDAENLSNMTLYCKNDLVDAKLQFDAEEEAYGNWVFIKGKDTPDGEKFHKHRKAVMTRVREAANKRTKSDTCARADFFDFVAKHIENYDFYVDYCRAYPDEKFKCWIKISTGCYFDAIILLFYMGYYDEDLPDIAEVGMTVVNDFYEHCTDKEFLDDIYDWLEQILYTRVDEWDEYGRILPKYDGSVYENEERRELLKRKLRCSIDTSGFENANEKQSNSDIATRISKFHGFDTSDDYFKVDGTVALGRLKYEFSFRMTNETELQIEVFANGVHIVQKADFDDRRHIEVCVIENKDSDTTNRWVSRKKSCMASICNTIKQYINTNFDAWIEFFNFIVWKTNMSEVELVSVTAHPEEKYECFTEFIKDGFLGKCGVKYNFGYAENEMPIVCATAFPNENLLKTEANCDALEHIGMWLQDYFERRIGEGDDDGNFKPEYDGSMAEKPLRKAFVEDSLHVKIKLEGFNNCIDCTDKFKEIGKKKK